MIEKGRKPLGNRELVNLDSHLCYTLFAFFLVRSWKKLNLNHYNLISWIFCQISSKVNQQINLTSNYLKTYSDSGIYVYLICLSHNAYKIKFIFQLVNMLEILIKKMNKIHFKTFNCTKHCSLYRTMHHLEHLFANVSLCMHAVFLLAQEY